MYWDLPERLKYQKSTGITNYLYLSGEKKGGLDFDSGSLFYLLRRNRKEQPPAPRSIIKDKIAKNTKLI